MNASPSVKYKTVLIVVASCLFAMISGILSQDWLMGSAILFCGLLSAYFASIGKRSNYVFGLMSYLLMGYVAFRNHLYGTGGFYVLACAPLQIQGFVTWGKNLKDDSVKQRRFTAKVSIIVILACVASSAVVGYLLSLIPSQQMSFLDAATNCVNLCGIILMNLRYMEAWWLWLINNVLDLTIWTCILIAGGDSAVMMFLTCVMYLVINVYGIYKWMRGSKETARASKS